MFISWNVQGQRVCHLREVLIHKEAPRDKTHLFGVLMVINLVNSLFMIINEMHNDLWDKS